MLDDAVEDRVGAEVLVYPEVPLVGLELRGDHRRAPALARLQDLEEVDDVAAVLDGRGEEVVDDEQVDLGEPVDRRVQLALGTGDGELAAHVVEPDVAHGVLPTACGDPQGLREVALAAAGLGDDDQVLHRVDPSATGEARHAVLAEAPVGQVG